MLSTPVTALTATASSTDLNELITITGITDAETVSTPAVAAVPLRTRLRTLAHDYSTLLPLVLLLTGLLLGCWAIATHGQELTWAEIVAGAKSIRLK